MSLSRFLGVYYKLPKPKLGGDNKLRAPEAKSKCRQRGAVEPRSCLGQRYGSHPCNLALTSLRDFSEKEHLVGDQCKYHLEEEQPPSKVHLSKTQLKIPNILKSQLSIHARMFE